MRIIVLLLMSLGTFAQSAKPVGRPKLVVGLVVDQMRWDYLYRYYDRYAPDGGFRRLISKGFSCENTIIDYIPTYTACGHTTLYTGSVPAIHGITGNEWHDNFAGKTVYCTEDSSVSGVGTNGPAGKMSPRNMMVTTICDELKIASNFRSKVIGIAFKDRGGILPAGHSANAAYWYEGASGNWITSTYYMDKLPKWVEDLNAKKLPDAYYKQGWKTLYPIASYKQSTSDEQTYEGQPLGQKKFPYDLTGFIGKNYGALASTPFGNTLTREMSCAAISAEQMGKDSITDFLAVSFSTPDYVGHAYGPNSIEVEDTYLRLDKELGELLRYLDEHVGKNQYLVFLSADHAVAHAVGFSKQNKLPGGGFLDQSIKDLDSLIKKQYGNYNIIEAYENSQIFFDHELIDSLELDKKNISAFIYSYLSKKEGVFRVFTNAELMTVPLPEDVRKKAVNGFYPPRSGDIQILLKSGWMSGGATGTTHGSGYAYDTHIPLLWYGWSVKPGKTNRETHMTDVAPTLAAFLKIQMPSGSIGQVIRELTTP